MNTSKGKKAAEFVKVRRITNPFEPMRDVREEQWKWRKTYTLDRYLPLGEATDVVVSLNGLAIDRERFAKTRLQPNDFIVICPVPQGGGGKGIFRIVGMIAIAVASVYTGGLAAAAYTGAASASAAAAAGLGTTFAMVQAGVAAAVTIAGSMLLNAVLPPAVATVNTNSGLAASSTYGADGAKNTAAEMIPTPVAYGTFRTAGNVIGVHTEADGNNQILYMLINAGEGPIASISGIKINDRDLSEFSEVSVQTRLGDPMQAPIDWFSSVITPYSKQVKLPKDGSYLTFATQGNVEAVRVDFNFPSGLYSVSTKSGSFENNSVALEADYRLVGSSDWTPFTNSAPRYVNARVTPITSIGVGNVPGTLYDSENYQWDATQVITDLNISTDNGIVLDTVRAAVMAKYGSYVGQQVSKWPVSKAGTVSVAVTVPAGSAALVVTEKLQSTVRRSYLSPQLTLGKYEVRVRRNPNYIDYSANTHGTKITTDTSTTASSDCYVGDVNEILYEGVGYNHTALLAIRVKMDDQISGVPSVTFINGGRVIPTFTRSSGVISQVDKANNNPAWVLWDALTHWRYGGGIDTSRLNRDAFFDLAEHCDANGLTYDGVFDTNMNIWDACQYIARTGHAQLVPVGTRYSVIIERASDPVMMFGMGNIVEGTFKQSWMSRTDRATEVDVTFSDKDDDYKSKTVKVADASAALEGRPQNAAAITAYGVVDIQRAYKEGALQLNINRYLTQTAEWQSPIEALACAAGDVVLVQHDQPAWAYSGRLAGGSSASVIKLDKTVTMAAGKTYKLLLLANTANRGTGTVTSVGDNFLAIPGTPTTMRVRRVRNANGVEAGITAVVGDGVYVDSANGFAAGQPITFWDTDVIEDHDVTLAVGDTDTLTLRSPLGFVPDQFTNYMFGETEKVKKSFRITDITLGSTDMTRAIKALEYVAEVYDLSSYKDVADTLTPPMLDPSQAAIGVVQNVSAYEETYVQGAQILSQVRTTWAQPVAGNYAGAKVFVQKNGGAFNLTGTVKADTSFIVPGVQKGDQLTIKVQAFDIWGKDSSYDQSPMVSYKVVGTVTALSTAVVSGADYLWAGRDCKLFWRYNSVTASFEFGSEPNGADTGARDPHFLDYEIRVYAKPNYGTKDQRLLRTEHTTDNSYIYTYEKNFVDGLHRELVFEIAVRDQFGNVGKAAVLDCYNPPPTVLTAATNANFESITVSFTHSDDPDYAGARIMLRWSGDVGAPATPAYDGPDTTVLLSGLMFNADYYITIVPYDAFGLDETIPTNEIHVHTPFLDVEAIAEGVLKDSQLIPALKTRIDLVDAPDTIIGSVNNRLKNTSDTLTATANALNASLTTAITNEATTRKNATDSLATQINTVSAATNSNGAAIQSETTARTTADSALGTRIDTVVAQSNGNTAAIQTETTARANADGALSTRIDTLLATTNGNTAAITSEVSARTTADTALSTRIDTLAANTGNNTAAVQQEASARTSADSALATQINTVAASFGFDATNLCANPVAAGGLTTGWTNNTAVGGTTGDVPLGAPAAYVFRQNIRDNSYTTRTVPVSGGQTHYLEMRAATPVAAVPISIGLHLTGAGKSDTWVFAATQAATSTWTRMAGNVTIPDGYTTAELYVMIDFGASSNNDKNRWYYTDIEWRPASQVQPAMAAISTEQTARANADGALSTRIDSVNASLGTTNANVQTEINARAAGDSANASSITQINSTLGSHTASISTQQSSLNGLNAQYTVKIDNNGLISGFGLASYPINGGIVSEFAVHAQRFSVWIPGYPGIQPFTIGVVNGQPRVIISNALIGDASIANAMIGDAQINSAKIAYAAINTAHIGQAQIDTLRIGPNAVSTMASWGGTGVPTYYASGGDVLVFISANLGLYNSSTGANQSGQASVTVNGQQVVIGNDRGDRACSFMRITGMNGAYAVNIQASGSGVSNVQTAIFEAKR
jgi:predicted phage tail protein